MRTLVIVGLIAGAVAILAPDQGAGLPALGRPWIWLGNWARGCS